MKHTERAIGAETLRSWIMDNEEWRDIEGYEGLYQVSSLGRIRNKHGNILKPQLRERKGHKAFKIKLSMGGSKCFFIHRLVAAAFLNNDGNKPQIDHINRDSLDNRACNLRWATDKENKQNKSNSKKQ